VITDRGVLRPDPATHELTLVATHPGVDLDSVLGHTGWELRVAETVDVTEPPSPGELGILRDLKERTRRAHTAG
jgi:glutaconate CoA-transferase subunit B